jgi:aldose 1-epimerase
MAIQPFGRTPDGTDIGEVVLATPGGLEAKIIEFGATVRDLVVPLAGGKRRVVLGFDTLEGYLGNGGYIGVTAGRHASRTGGGKLPVEGRVHQLTLNNGPNHLHGGTAGFSHRPWRIVAHDAESVTLALTSPDGDQGYPGTVEARCTYRLLDPGTLRVVMTATTDAPTFVSLAHHSYFTLTPGRSIRDHRLQVNARHYTPMDEALIPTGEIRAVAGTPFDFRASRPIGQDPSFTYDCNLVLDGPRGALSWAATLEAPDGSLAMETHTTEPCLVFYDALHLPAEPRGLDGMPHGPHAGLCLEPMRFPDNANKPWFPSALLRPGELYRQVTEYRFAAP